MTEEKPKSAAELYEEIRSLIVRELEDTAELLTHKILTKDWMDDDDRGWHDYCKYHGAQMAAYESLIVELRNRYKHIELSEEF